MGKDVSGSSIPTWIREDLVKSGLTIQDMTIVPLVKEEQLRECLGFTTFENTNIMEVGGYFIGYSNVANYYRLKLRRAIGSCKYLSPSKKKGLGNHPYVPEGAIEDLINYKPDVPVIITEGEKKAQAAFKAGFLCIGLAGVWNFKEADNDFMQGLEELNFKHRTVYIGFDSDIKEKTNVKQAELRLAVELANRGAEVRSLRLPQAKDQ